MGRTTQRRKMSQQLKKGQGMFPLVGPDCGCSCGQDINIVYGLCWVGPKISSVSDDAHYLIHDV